MTEASSARLGLGSARLKLPLVISWMGVRLRYLAQSRPGNENLAVQNLLR